MLFRDPFARSSALPLFATSPNLFSQSECAKIISDAQSRLPLTDGTVGDNTISTATTKKIRSSGVRWMPCQDPFQWVYDRIDACVETINARWFQFDLFGYETIQFTEYRGKTRQKYNWHTDTMFDPNCSDRQAWMKTSRKLSVSISLTQQELDFEGGDFQMNNFESPTTINLDLGDAVVFPSFLTHRVTPVTLGKRISLVVWVCGSKFR